MASWGTSSCACVASRAPGPREVCLAPALLTADSARRPPPLRSWVDKAKLEKYAHKPSEDTLVMMCGLPVMYDVFCGPRDEEELKEGSVLDQLGYTTDMVAKCVAARLRCATSAARVRLAAIAWRPQLAPLTRFSPAALPPQVLKRRATTNCAGRAPATPPAAPATTPRTVL